ncbi:hypothetical protein CC77DRAFT_1073423 [Alternaria alternata]|uniref:Uncharacterized protein n=1 Tax=Alternaria alternata TaxID=5599 RepID=A0A177DGA7_ALTAL|nr:hypothetical protein CC77DRAFT_1073423 [Alternaria alternata]KAH6863889.1 hypothetical protein B0T12DRAFT_390330 [Alternaria alternata]OAG18516.1 hypothetical protein CC77DRAFT_1073423 [Alternaria alternata]
MSEVAAESKASNVATLAATSAFMYDGGADVLPEPGRRAGRLPPLGSSAAQSLVVIWLLDRGVPVAKECESDDFSLSRKQPRKPGAMHETRTWRRQVAAHDRHHSLGPRRRMVISRGGFSHLSMYEAAMASAGGVEIGIVRREGTNIPVDKHDKGGTTEPWKSDSTTPDPSEHHFSLPRVQGCLQ